jgi:hypothetical protein
LSERVGIVVARCGPQHGDELVELAATQYVLQPHEGVVLVAVGDRVEPQHGRLRRQRHVEESRARHGIATRSQHPDVALGQGLGGRPARTLIELAEPDEVGVRIEDHHRQRRVGDELLEHHAERVGLARTTLTAPERVPVEALGQQARRATRRCEVDPHLELCARGRVQLLDRGLVDRLEQRRLERMARARVDALIGELADEAPAQAHR